MLQKKLLHCEVVKNSTKDLFPSCIMLTNIGSTEEKYVLKASAMLLASVRVSSPTINLFGKDSLPTLINCLIPLHVAFVSIIMIIYAGLLSVVEFSYLVIASCTPRVLGCCSYSLHDCL